MQDLWVICAIGDCCTIKIFLIWWYALLLVPLSFLEGNETKRCQLRTAKPSPIQFSIHSTTHLRPLLATLDEFPCDPSLSLAAKVQQTEGIDSPCQRPFLCLRPSSRAKCSACASSHETALGHEGQPLTNWSSTLSSERSPHPPRLPLFALTPTAYNSICDPISKYNGRRSRY